MYFLFLLLFLLFLLYTSWWLWKRKLSFLPCTPDVPWLGCIPYLSLDPHVNYKKRLEDIYKYDHLYMDWFGSTPIVNFGTAEHIEALLSSRELTTKSFFYKLLDEWLGDGLAFSSGIKWKKRRTALTSAFHFTILNDFVDVFEKHAQGLVDTIKTFCVDNETIEVQELFSQVMLNVICETSMGFEVNAVDTSDAIYVKAVHKLKVLIAKRIYSPLTAHKYIFPFTPTGKEYFKWLKIFHAFTEKVVKDRIADRKEDKGLKENDEDGRNGSYARKKKVFIDILVDLHMRGEIDVEGMCEEVNTFMFAGHDSTSTTLSWSVYEIGRHPEVQQQLQAEIDAIASPDSYSSCTMDKIRSLKYLDCVIKETLRLHPPLADVSRTAEKDVVIEKQTFPAGTVLAADVMSVHLNPLYWENPTEYDPSRFEKEAFAKRHPYSYIPFSAGPRNCIGQKFALLEEKMFLYLIFLNFNAESIHKSLDEVKPGFELITTAMNGLHIKFSKRKLDNRCM